MSTELKIAQALLATIVTHDLVVAVRNRRRNENTLANLNEELRVSHARSYYLASIIDRNEIKLSEFDKIAIVHPLYEK